MRTRPQGLLIGRLPGEHAVDLVLIERATAELRSIDRVRGLAYARAVGAFLLQTFFEDSSRACAQRAAGHRSYRALAARADLPMSRSTLYRCVQVELQCRELPSALAASLSVSHHAALFSVTDAERKRRLAERAISESMTFRALVQAERQGRVEVDHETRRGRPPLPPLVKGVNRLTRALEDVREVQLPPDEIAQYGAARCRAMRDTLQADLEVLHAVHDRVCVAIEQAERDGLSPARMNGVDLAATR